MFNIHLQGNIHEGKKLIFLTSTTTNNCTVLEPEEDMDVRRVCVCCLHSVTLSTVCPMHTMYATCIEQRIKHRMLYLQYAHECSNV
jgi:hypothetical protein